MDNNKSPVVTLLFVILSFFSFKAHAVYVEYYQIDHSASNRLQIDDTLEGDNNISAAEEAHINITGSQAEFGARVMVIINDQNNRSIGPLNATIEQNGRWYIANLDTSPLVDGDLQITAIETDTLGNVSEPVSKILHKDSLGPNSAFVNLNSLFGN